MAERDEKGRFIHTGKTTSDYFFGKNGHRAIWEKENGKVPKGYVIHHINGDKFDNRIENLEMMTFTRHNNIHKHRSWCTGLTRETSETLDKAILKRMKTKKVNYLKKCKEAYLLHLKGKTAREIAEIQEVCTRSIYQRLTEIKDGNIRGNNL